MGCVLKVLIPYYADWVRLVREGLKDSVEIVQSDRSLESMLDIGGDAEIIVSGRVTGDFIRAAKKLRMIQAFGAGVDKIDLKAAAERGDILICNSHVNAAEVAEYAIGLLLAAAKNIVLSDRTMRKSDWTHRWGGPIPNIEFRGKQCLLLGLGNIGLEIAKRLKAFNMEINAVTRSGTTKHTDVVEMVSAYNKMEPLIKSADFVILALPLTQETRGLVGDAFLSHMKSTSIIINVSRGAIIDEAALYRALKNHQIGGAAIDVWWDYPSRSEQTHTPPSRRYPFHELDNIILTPHRAAYSETTLLEQVNFLIDNIKRFARGETPHNIVDLMRGY